MQRLLLICLLMTAAGVHAETYRWVDAAGRTVISDTPPNGPVKGLVASTAKAPQPGDGLSYAARRAAEAFPVTLYTAPDCGNDCSQARELLAGRGVPFTEKTLRSPEEAAELKQLVGDAFVPSLKVGNQRFRGFESGAYDNLLDLAGYPKKGGRP